ncbi:helix-turn-helix domain-containing protein [Aquidulcibacter sp.]|uniref:helix-turn-helix domain-containing protein n=1 Tax=Aquidulcibacter sp. TaxID=2052990 RepID=UPI0025C0530A|nr:helix-turn-helix domain-containing protein [Aquidulcibacter sp.]MCA3695108.1 helix-turn-helix domain-containing protein [Aquidulcibacter sp.]
MSGLVQGMVWRARLERACDGAEAPGPWVKPVLCRLADEADDEGFDVWPSVATVAGDVGVSEATVQRALRWLKAVDLIRVDGLASGGRGRTTRYWINVGLLQDIRRGPSRVKDAPPPALHNAQKGCHTDTLLQVREDQKGVTESLKGVRKRLKGVTSDTLPYTHTTLSARDRLSSRSSVRPKGRSPGSSEVKSGQELEQLVKDLDVPVDKEAFEAWGALVAAIVAKREQEAARAWLSRQSGAAVERVGLITVSSPFKREKACQALGALLDEVGWQVTVRGSG